MESIQKRYYRIPTSTELVYGYIVKRINRAHHLSKSDQNAQEDIGFEITDAIRELEKRKKSSLLFSYFTLNTDLAKTNAYLKGTIILPYKVTNKFNLLVFARDQSLIQKAKDMGASIAGGEDLIPSILDGSLIFDKVIATPDMMPIVTKAARILGPKGLMPSLKAGTLTENIELAIQSIGNASIYSFEKTSSEVCLPFASVENNEHQKKSNILSAVQQISILGKGSKKDPFIKALEIGYDEDSKTDRIQIKLSELQLAYNSPTFSTIPLQ